MELMTADDLRAFCPRPEPSFWVDRPGRGPVEMRVFDGLGGANVTRVLRDWFKPCDRIRLLGAECMVKDVDRGYRARDILGRPKVVLLHANAAGTGLAETVLDEVQAMALLDDLVGQNLPAL